MPEPADPMPLDEALRVAARIVAKPYQAPTVGERAAVRLAAEVQMLRAGTAEPDRHVYLSTSCRHDKHGRCAADTATDTEGHEFRRRPAQCKFCQAPCVCPCHQSDSP